MPTHAVVWIDHREAHVFHVHPDSIDETTLLAPQHRVHRHPKGRWRGNSTVDAILIVGPSSAKTELSQYMKDHAPLVAAKVVGIESVDHPTGGQLVAMARQHFRATDRMAGEGPLPL